MNFIQKEVEKTKKDLEAKEMKMGRASVGNK